MSAAVRTYYVHIIHIRSVQLNALIYVLHCLFSKFFSASYTFKMAAFTAPYRYRRTPVSVS